MSESVLSTLSLVRWSTSSSMAPVTDSVGDMNGLEAELRYRMTRNGGTKRKKSRFRPSRETCQVLSVDSRRTCFTDGHHRRRRRRPLPNDRTSNAMDVDTQPASASANIETADTPQPKKISAYYSLVFPNFTFYIQTLSVTIGRRCSPNLNAATSSSSPSDLTQVDVDLGALKSVSRLHARIEYDEEEDRFVLVVIGRNGAWVDGVWSGSGTRAPLGERCEFRLLF